MQFPDFKDFSPVRVNEHDTMDSVIQRAKQANALLLQEGGLHFILYGKLGEPAFLSRYALWCYLNPTTAIAINLAIAELKQGPFVFLKGEKVGK